MYTEHFGLTEAPFSIAPNPQYLYMSPRHKDALAHLLYGVQSDGGFILLTGEVGTGKTTLCRCLLQQVPKDVDTAFVLNPLVTNIELLATICDEFGIEYPSGASLKQLVDRLNEFLLTCHARGRKAVLIIDEAQNLSRDLLEQLRLLTNLETSERKLLQIILLGQPELLDILSQPSLRQFSQRITARFHLESLTRAETRHYIRHRLSVAGGDPSTFSSGAQDRVYRISGGIPRLINLICDRALLGAYAQDEHLVKSKTVNRAAAEVLGVQRRNRRPYWLTAGVVVTVTLLAGIAMFEYQPLREHRIASAEPTLLAAPEPVNQVVIGHQDVRDAYHDLFALWGTAFADQTTEPCELARSIGLKCHEQQADLANLRNLNRPAIVRIDDRFLTVSGLTDRSVTLIAGPRQYELPAEEFANRHNGIVRLIWRTPPAYTQPLKVADTGAAVDWLVVQLSMIEGQAPPLRTGFVYNESIESRVRHFQSSVGLSPSGVVDELTWIHINNVEAINIPTLNRTDQG